MTLVRLNRPAVCMAPRAGRPAFGAHPTAPAFPIGKALARLALCQTDRDRLALALQVLESPDSARYTRGEYDQFRQAALGPVQGKEAHKLLEAVFRQRGNAPLPAGRGLTRYEEAVTAAKQWVRQELARDPGYLQGLRPLFDTLRESDRALGRATTVIERLETTLATASQFMGMCLKRLGVAN